MIEEEIDVRESCLSPKTYDANDFPEIRGTASNDKSSNAGSNNYIWNQISIKSKSDYVNRFQSEYTDGQFSLVNPIEEDRDDLEDDGNEQDIEMDNEEEGDSHAQRLHSNMQSFRDDLSIQKINSLSKNKV